MMFIKNFTLVVVFLLCTLSVLADEKVGNIKVVGNQRVPTDTIIFYLDFKQGHGVAQESIDKSVKNLYATGFFANISIKKNSNNTVLVEVQENPVIRKITVEGSKKLKGDKIKGELLSKEGNVYSKFQMESDIKRLAAVYKKMGYYSTDVHYSLKTLNQNSVDVSIIVNEGKKPVIKKITFLGNKKYSERDLQKIIASKEKAWYRLFSSHDLYDQDRILLDKDLLREHYMQEGYATFKVLSSASEITPNNESFLITYLIHEGERFNFGKTSVDCRIKDIKTSDLMNSVQYKEGQIFNERLIDKTVDEITKYLGNNGYTFTNVDYELVKDEKNKIVNVKFIAHETSKYFVRNINISGNTRTLDRVIRREFKIYEGDPYNLSKIQRSKQKIVNLGYFSSVEIENKATPERDKIDLDVKVKETSTGSIRFAIGYNTAVGPIGSATFSEYNFLGKGQIIDLDVSKAKKDSSISFGFTEPRFMDRNLSVGFDVFANSQNNIIKYSFSSKTKGGTLRMGYDINDHLYHNLHYTLKSEKITREKDATAFIKSQPHKSLASSVGHSLTYDKLDSRINPTKGYILRFSENFAGVGGNVKYLQHQLYGSFYTPIYKDDVILNIIGRAGDIRGVGGQNVSISNSFFVGEEYLRGFESIGPRVKADSSAGGAQSGESLGGKQFIAGTVEMQFPLGLPTEFGMKGAIFTDFGTLYNTDALKYKCTEAADVCAGDKFKEDSIYNVKKFRGSYGAGILWDSPLGFIRLDYGVAFKKEKFDNLQRIRFSMGTNF